MANILLPILPLKTIYQMQTIQPIQRENETRYFKIVETGERIYGLVYRRNTKVDLINRTYITISEKEEYAASPLPTINDLVPAGTLKEVDEIEELTITANVVNLLDFDAVISFAKEKGFNVEREALRHNVECWERDFKSAYRGKECHVYTPCRCNPLRFTVTKLDDRAADWQITYYA